MNRMKSNLKTELQAGRSVLVFTTGTSMEPLLYDKRKKQGTHVLVEPVCDRMQKGDLPLIFLEDGRYMIHRIIRVREKDGMPHYQTRGDNCIGSEQVMAEQIYGKVTEIYRKGHKISVEDRSYRIYARFWMGIYPLRRLWKKGIGILAKIKRKWK